MKSQIRRLSCNLFGSRFTHNLHWLYRQIKPIKAPRNESLYMEMVSRYILPGTNVIDIGANVGIWTDHLSTIVGEDGRVIAFEPLPESYRFLERRFISRMNIQLINLALSDSSDIKELLVDPSSFAPSDTSVKETADQIRNVAKYRLLQIATEKLDDVLKRINIGTISFIKCDVEGHEEKVLLGAKCIIKNSKPVIFMEILREKWSNNDPTRSNSASILLDMGYKMGQVAEGGIQFNKSDFDYRIENFIFIR